jgi:hypothetical protein
MTLYIAFIPTSIPTSGYVNCSLDLARDLGMERDVSGL